MNLIISVFQELKIFLKKYLTEVEGKREHFVIHILPLYFLFFDLRMNSIKEKKGSMRDFPVLHGGPEKRLAGSDFSHTCRCYNLFSYETSKEGNT